MSSKTPKESAKKTKSAPKFIGIVIVALVSALIISFVASITVHDNKTNLSCLVNQDNCYTLERVDTVASRAQGLSGRDSLAPMTGMLFVFDQPADQCFWMKGMKFSIDIIWLDASNRINRIEKNLSPSTYPQQYCKADTKSVLELNAGEAERLNLQPGQQLSI